MKSTTPRIAMNGGADGFLENRECVCWNDDYEAGLDDSDLIRLELGEEYFTSYMFTAEREPCPEREDMFRLEWEKTYVVSLRQRMWWWMYEDQMGSGQEEISEEQKEERISR